ncbi:MAG: recombinase family protein [Clostridia bacterium]|nr:recombinase family protein [Clostridia bacterium]
MAKVVRKIEAAAPAPVKLKRVAAYARVSMETERLNHSLSAQVSYYSELIQKHPGWVYAGVYADDGISGTKVNRPEFQKMLADCEAGSIDIILTKSISRFARNTVDLLGTVRHLKELGIEVQFEKEHISSLSEDGELMLSLLASFAQEESRSISDNCKWGIRKRMEQGIPNGHFRVYGYHWEGDTLVPTPEEAIIVKRIFQNFLDGKSRLETEREFAAQGITTREGNRWVDSNIKSILCNVTYTRNLLLQKEFMSDPITKKRKKNRGELTQYYVPNTHEAIIDKETFDYVQAEMARRRELGPLANKALNTTCFTGKIKCAFCGQSYMHSQRLNRAKRTQQPEKMEIWSCGSRKKKGGHCIGKEIPHRIILQETASAMGFDEFDEQAFLEQIDHIAVTGARELTFHFKDSHTVVRQWMNTSKRDCWTAEYRAEASAYRRSHQALGKKGSSCFTSKIKCGECGNNFQHQTRSYRDGKVGVWTCATKRNRADDCSMPTVREDVLKALCCEALEMEVFDPAIFSARVDHITFTGKGALSIVLKDGTSQNMTFSTIRRMPPASEETRRKRSEAMKARITPELRQQMSEHMKEVRRNKHWNNKGKS